MSEPALRVLHIEDDPDTADLVRVILAEDEEEGGFDIEWIQNLTEALPRLTHPGIDVVLLDLGMPELKGFRSYRLIEAVAGCKYPIVVLTADDRGMSRDITLSLGAAEYLVKPDISHHALKEALRKAVLHHRNLNSRGAAGH